MSHSGDSAIEPTIQTLASIPVPSDLSYRRYISQILEAIAQAPCLEFSVTSRAIAISLVCIANCLLAWHNQRKPEEGDSHRDQTSPLVLFSLVVDMLVNLTYFLPDFAHALLAVDSGPGQSNLIDMTCNFIDQHFTPSKLESSYEFAGRHVILLLEALCWKASRNNDL